MLSIVDFGVNLVLLHGNHVFLPFFTFNLSLSLSLSLSAFSWALKFYAALSTEVQNHFQSSSFWSIMG